MAFGIGIALGVVVAAALAWFGLRAGLAKLRRRRWLDRHGDPDMVETMMAGQIARGMTLDMVLDVWGRPADMDETVMKTKTKRQLKYDQTGKNRFGTRVYLENGVVVGWETK